MVESTIVEDILTSQLGCKVNKFFMKILSWFFVQKYIFMVHTIYDKHIF
jgi:hypothetical protein